MPNPINTPVIIVDGEPIQFADRTQIAWMLGVTPDTISTWVKADRLPKPFDMTRGSRSKSNTRGRKALMWNAKEVLKIVMSSR